VPLAPGARNIQKKETTAARASSLWRGLPLASLLTIAALPVARAEKSLPDGFTFAAGGDIIGPRGPLTEAFATDFRQIADLFRGADIGIANLEGAVFDLATFDGYPAAENGGGYPLYPTTLPGELRDMGITLVGKANNHATDWGAQGLVATLQSLATAGIAQAGTGMSLAEARAAAYVKTAHGRAALVSTATTFPPMSVAGGTVTRFGIESAPRPGISAIRIRKIRRVPAADLDALRRIGGPIAREVGGRSDEVRVDDQVFRAADHYGFEWETNPEDEAAVLDSIRAADANADFVAFMIHTHETAGNEDDIALGDYELAVLHRANEVPSPDEPMPAAFQPVLFHKAIDAGADAVIRTGPHVLGGIEIYRDRPIFYSLGSLFLLFCGDRTYQAPGGQIKKLPDEWYETVIPVTRYADGRLGEIRLYPAVIQWEPGPLCSVPRPADAAEAARILERIRERSAVFGTTVTIRDGVGFITP
jgi:poly-gamma-glutamate capsule biosynthesis protein CapA/YwtB (metallophosphatase superfamily)